MPRLRDRKGIAEYASIRNQHFIRNPRAQNVLHEGILIPLSTLSERTHQMIIQRLPEGINQILFVQRLQRPAAAAIIAGTLLQERGDFPAVAPGF